MTTRVFNPAHRYLLWLAKSKFIRSLAKTIPFALVILLWAWGRETFSEAVAATRTTVQAHHQAEVRRLRTGFALALLLFVQRAYQMTQANVDLIVRMDEEIVEKEIVNFRCVMWFFTSLLSSVCLVTSLTCRCQTAALSVVHGCQTAAFSVVHGADLHQ